MGEMKDPSLSPKKWPEQPGVYLMKDRAGTVLYVGKAKSLKKRLASYFRRSGPPDPKTSCLVSQVASLETRVTASEVEALLLESRLVKDLQPRYNIELKDDKSFPFLVAALKQDFPRVFLTRQPAQAGETRFGPFTDAAGLFAAFRALQAVFRFRPCTLPLAEGEKRRRRRPCLLHAVARCTGPCAGLISTLAYRQDIDDLLRFLRGERAAVLEGILGDFTAGRVTARSRPSARAGRRLPKR